MKKTILIVTIISIMFVMGCSKKTEKVKNIEQLQREQGIPVKTTIITPTNFKQEFVYNATMIGAEESTAQAMLSDFVTSINAQIGDYVNAGQTIVTFPRNSAMAQLEQATTAFNSTKQVYERMQRLHEQGAVSQQDLDNARTGFEVSQANLNTANSMVNITSPISGVITNIMVNKGEKCFPGQALFSVAGRSGYKAIVNVPESDISSIRRGTNVTATWNGIDISGRVNQIAMALDPNTKAFRVECLFPGYNRNISYGVTAQVKLMVKNISNAFVVDRQHITEDNGKTYVWLNKDGKAVKTEIITGLNNQLSYEVTSGLSEGDELIIEGINLLTDNTKILISQ